MASEIGPVQELAFHLYFSLLESEIRVKKAFTQTFAFTTAALDHISTKSKIAGRTFSVQHLLINLGARLAKRSSLEMGAVLLVAFLFLASLTLITGVYR